MFSTSDLGLKKKRSVLLRESNTSVGLRDVNSRLVRGTMGFVLERQMGRSKTRSTPPAPPEYRGGFVRLTNGSSDERVE